MTDLSKLKRRTSLGAPPPIEEASTNLTAPETAPVAEVMVKPVPTVKPKETAGRGAKPVPASMDGRSARRTNRTVQFATRVSPEFDSRIREISRRDGLLLVEVMEEALAAYEARHV